MMGQNGQWEMSAEDKQRQWALEQHAAMRKQPYPFGLSGQAAMMNTNRQGYFGHGASGFLPVGPYESASMNAKLAAAKKYLQKG